MAEVEDHQAQHTFWEKSFAGEQGDCKDDWIAEPSELSVVLSKHVRAGARILVVGAGQSALPRFLHSELGCVNITSTDISTVAVEAMRVRDKDLPPSMRWEVADATELSQYAPGHFDVVLDKGCSDTFLFRYKSNLRLQMVSRMFAAVCRVLRPGGTYVNITPRKSVPAISDQDWTVTREKLPIGPNTVLPRRKALQKRRTHIYVHVCIKNNGAQKNPDSAGLQAPPQKSNRALRRALVANKQSRPQEQHANSTDSRPRRRSWWGPVVVAGVALLFLRAWRKST